MYKINICKSKLTPGLSRCIFTRGCIFAHVQINFYIYAIGHFQDIPMDSQTTDITHFSGFFFIMTSQLKQWKHCEAQLMTYDVIMKNNGKVRDVRSLACKIKVLNARLQGT